MAVEIIIVDKTLTEENVTDSGFDVSFQGANVSYDVSGNLVDSPEVASAQVGMVVSAEGFLIDSSEILVGQADAQVQASLQGSLVDSEETLEGVIGKFDIVLIEIDSAFEDIAVPSTINPTIIFKSKF